MALVDYIRIQRKFIWFQWVTIPESAFSPLVNFIVLNDNLIK
jgi:hypothetical protein